MTKHKLTPDEFLQKYKQGIKRVQKRLKPFSTDDKLRVINRIQQGMTLDEAIEDVKGGKP